MHPPEAREAICARLAAGESLRKAADAEGVAPSTVLLWVNTDAAFSEQYARAREIGYRLLADEIIEISDEAEFEPVKGPDGETLEVRIDATTVARNRLRVDARKWMLSKMLPKVYGDKMQMTGDGGGPIEHGVTLNIVGVPAIK